MFYLYKWKNLKPFSPQEQVRNEWLFKYGAFGCYNGIWFPAKVLKYNHIGDPATIVAIPIANTNVDIYPKGELLVDNCDAFYSVFSNGMSIQAYIAKGIALERVTDRMLYSAIKRSLNTEIIHAPKRLIKDMKKAVNRQDKEEVFVIDGTLKDDMGIIQIPSTINIVEKLWNNKDWARQELSQLLGITYNPSQGKKERMISSELLGDRDLTVMNREMLTSRLINSAEKYGEFVVHISTEIDTIDRKLEYATGGGNKWN